MSWRSMAGGLCCPSLHRRAGLLCCTTWRILPVLAPLVAYFGVLLISGSKAHAFAALLRLEGASLPLFAGIA